MGGGDGTKYTAKDHPEERELAKIAKEQWGEYKSRYIPIENEWMENVKGLDSEGAHEGTRGMAGAEFQHANPDGVNRMQRGMGRGDAYRRSNAASVLTTSANNLSQIKNRASLGVTDRYVRGMENVIGIGQGVKTQGLQGLTDVAEQSVQGRIENSKNRFTRDQGSLDSMGSLAGGVSAYGLGKRSKK
ncbi:MAG TPA: hypothetical protein EYQ00_02540 [Dehalococcoidia bacterium]|jgi:hypothetical protein|nr:hypothetical protein [Dehalococcoidia bacterium]